jgi:hypothetical protein
MASKKKSSDAEPSDVQINRSMIPGISQGHVEIEITYNFILDLYEESKALEGEEKEEMLSTINELTKHVGKWLIS